MSNAQTAALFHPKELHQLSSELLWKVAKVKSVPLPPIRNKISTKARFHAN